MNKYKAFTIIEVAITLSVIAVIMGAALTSNAIIASVKLKSLITDFYKFEQMVNNFKNKYGYWPGDFPYASITFNNSNCINSLAPTGCNGNGNEKVETGANNAGEEFLRVWQHLRLANIIDGAYNASYGNLPKGKYKEGFYSFNYIRQTSGGNTLYEGHVVTYGRLNSSNSLAQTNILTAAEAYDLDIKMDDGRAGSGKLFGRNNISSNGCPRWDETGGYDYTLNVSGENCILVFWVDRTL